MAGVSTLLALAQTGAHHRHWYTNGVPVVHREASRLGCTPRELAAVLALTSPRVQVRRNVQLTRLYMADRARLRTLSAPDLASELRLLSSTAAALVHWEATGEIRGPKTRAFAAAVLGDPDALVLDVWMARALQVPQERVNLTANYAKALKRVRAVARRLGWTVAEVQAAVWAGTIAGHRDARGRRTYVDAPPLDRLLAA